MGRKTPLVPPFSPAQLALLSWAAREATQHSSQGVAHYIWEDFTTLVSLRQVSPCYPPGFPIRSAVHWEQTRRRCLEGKRSGYSHTAYETPAGRLWRDAMRAVEGVTMRTLQPTIKNLTRKHPLGV